MKIIAWLAVSLTLVTSAAAAAAQSAPAAPPAAAPTATPPATTPPAPRANPIAALGWLVGRWEGTGWIERGGRHPFRGTEIVEARLDGEALVIEGLHFATLPDGAERKVHHAVAVLGSRPDDSLRFETFLSGGRGGSFPARLDGDALIWEIPERGLRYEIRRDERGRWVERGTVSGEDGEDREVFGMVLERAE